MSTNNFIVDPAIASDSIYIDKLILSQLRLSKNASYPWFILVPTVNWEFEALEGENLGIIEEISELSQHQQNQLQKEIYFISQFLLSYFRPDKLNIANLGNVVPQLHIHLIARFKKDPSFPKPVWGDCQVTKYEEVAENKLIKELQEFISNYSWFINVAEQQNGPDSTNDNITTIKKQLRYRSNYRGCKETDFLIGCFADNFLKSSSEYEDLNFAIFLNESDNEIYDWVIEKNQPPKNYKKIINLIKKYHQENQILP